MVDIQIKSVRLLFDAPFDASIHLKLADLEHWLFGNWLRIWTQSVSILYVLENVFSKEASKKISKEYINQMFAVISTFKRRLDEEFLKNIMRY